MIDPNTARMLAHYNAWADKVLFEAVAALPPGEAAKERNSLFKSMIGTLNHNYVVALIWQAHLEGREHGFQARNLLLYPELDALRDAQDRLNQWYMAWVEGRTAKSLAERLPFVFIGGEKAVMSRAEMLLHVVNHGTYHRGWVAEMFFEVPAKAPATDLPVFLTRGPVPPTTPAIG